MNIRNIRIAVIAGLLAIFSLGACTAQKLKPSDFGIKSKKALSIFQKAVQNDRWRDRRMAVSLYKEALALEPDFGEANFRIGLDLYLLQEYEEGLPYMQKAEETWDKPAGTMSFYQAELNFYNYHYEKAEDYYSKFLKSNVRADKKIIAMAKINLKNAAFAKVAINDSIIFNPENLGLNINSIGAEYFPYLTADDQTIFLTSRRKGSTGGFVREYNGYAEDFYYASKKNGEWEPVKNLGPPVNTDYNEGAACFSPDGQYVYFTGCNRNDGFGSCDLYVSKLNGIKWEKPMNLGPLVNSNSWDSQPCLSNDGNTLYFSSNRTGGKGRNDIWYSQKVNGSWTAAQNLGFPVNTSDNDYAPFLHADGESFYFSSDGHPGFGGVDLFLSKRNSKGWSNPKNLGFPLNTTGDEANIFINASGTVGYINSDREGGYGGFDLYSFKLDPRIQPNFTSFVRGFVLDSISGRPLRARVTFINLATRDTIREVYSNKSSGKFLLSLPMNQEYAAFIDAKGYLFSSQNFSLKKLQSSKDQYFDLMIRLQPIQEGATVILQNIFYQTSKYDLKENSKTELDHLVQFLKMNAKVKIEIGGHTDNVGGDHDNQKLSENRAGACKKYLTSKGIAEERVRATGYGETKPITTNDTEVGRAENRRTEFKILHL